MYSIKRITYFIGLTMCVFSITTRAQPLSQTSQKDIESRISPVGSVYLKADITTHTLSKIEKKVIQPRTGMQVYNRYCVVCHATGVAGAPLKGNQQDWKPRLAKGMDSLLDNALTGFNAMPAMGTCIDCTKDEILKSIRFLSKTSQN